MQVCVRKYSVYSSDLSWLAKKVLQYDFYELLRRLSKTSCFDSDESVKEGLFFLPNGLSMPVVSRVEEASRLKMVWHAGLMFFFEAKLIRNHSENGLC